ncbi:MAG: N-acetylmuramoyl-L-alanine amidase [Merdibacter sp.]
MDQRQFGRSGGPCGNGDRSGGGLLSVGPSECQRLWGWRAGFEIYADPDDAEMWAMASAVEEQLAALDFSEDRGVKDAWDSQLYVICRNPIPSLLVEMGFISDSQDIDYILSHSRLLADAIAQGIIDSLEAK